MAGKSPFLEHSYEHSFGDITSDGSRWGLPEKAPPFLAAEIFDAPEAKVMLGIQEWKNPIPGIQISSVWKWTVWRDSCELSHVIFQSAPSDTVSQVIPTKTLWHPAFLSLKFELRVPLYRSSCCLIMPGKARLRITVYYCMMLSTSWSPESHLCYIPWYI